MSAAKPASPQHAAGRIAEFTRPTLGEQSEVLPATLLLRGVVLRRIVNAPSPCYIGALATRGRDAKYFVMLDQELGGWVASLSIDGSEHLVERGMTAVAVAQQLERRLDGAVDATIAEFLRGRR